MQGASGATVFAGNSEEVGEVDLSEVPPEARRSKHEAPPPGCNMRMHCETMLSCGHACAIHKIEPPHWQADERGQAEDMPVKLSNRFLQSLRGMLQEQNLELGGLLEVPLVSPTAEP